LSDKFFSNGLNSLSKFFRPCGKVCAFMEMINAESASAVYCFFQKKFKQMPRYVAFDFACQFSKFVDRR
jgi:hypothetical protein